MFSMITRMLRSTGFMQKSSNETAILETNSNNITNVANNITSNEIIELVDTYMGHSNNYFAKMIYQMIYDNPYAIFLLIVLSVLLLTIILRSFIYLFTTKNKKHHKRNFFKRIWNIFMSPTFMWSGLILGIVLALDVLMVPSFISSFIKTILLSILAWIIYIMSQKILDIYIRSLLIFKVNKNRRLKIFKNKNVLIVLHRSLAVAWILIFITILLGLWGVQLGPILAGLGIAGIVVGLALQDTLSHIVGGVSLMLDETYSEGDFIKLENGLDGVISQIGYRSTKLRTFDDEILTIPNGTLSKMMITNLSQPFKRVRATKYYQTVASDADPQTVKQLFLKAIKNVPSILNYPEPYVFFVEPKGSTYIFRVNFFVASYGIRMSETDLVQQEIVKIFQQNNIRFAVEESMIHTNSVSPYTQSSENSSEENQSSEGE